MAIEVPINSIEYKDGELQIHLGASPTNDDWIRARRLKRGTKVQKARFARLDKSQTIYIIDEE